MNAKEKPKGIGIRLSQENQIIMKKFRNRSKALSKAILEADLKMFQEVEEMSQPQIFRLNEDAINKLRRLPKGTRSKAVNYVISQMNLQDERSE